MSSDRCETFASHPSDPATPGHLKVNCPKGKRGHPRVPLRGEACDTMLFRTARKGGFLLIFNFL